MKPKHLILTLLAVFSSFSAKAANGDTFTVSIGDGNSRMTLKVLSEANRTVEVSSVSDNDVTAATIASTYTNGETEYTVVSIGNFAFLDKDNLIELNLPNTITRIGPKAFKGCIALGSLGHTFTIPSSVTTIESEAFYNCGFVAGPIPASVTSVGTDAFYGTGWLYNQADGIVYINNMVYTYKGTMPASSSLTVAEGTTRIINDAFKNQENLEAITLPSTLTAVGNYAFNGCNNLTTVIVNATTPPSCPSDAFSNAANCTLLVPYGQVEVYTAATGWKNFNPINENLDAPIVFENSTRKSICISRWDTNHDGELSYAEAAAVQSIPNSSVSSSSTTGPFMELKYFTNLTSIGEKAFFYQNNLTSISIPSNVRTIGNDAFNFCSDLNVVEYASIEAMCNITYGNYFSHPMLYGKHLYINGEEVKEIVVPSNVTSINNYAFLSCDYLKSVTIPSNVTSIGRSIVSNTSVMIFKNANPITYNDFGAAAYFVPDDAVDTYKAAWTSVADKIFGESDYNLKSYTITAKESSSALLDAIGGEEYTSSIFKLKILGTINSYDMMIMRNKMTNLRELDLSDASIVANSYNYGTGVSENNVFPDFLKDKKIDSIVLPNSITSISANALSGTNITSIVIPASVTSISDAVFPASLREVIFAPSSQLRTLGSAFKGTELRTFVAPSSLKYIKEWAFYCCDSLKSVILNEGLISIGKSAFSTCPKLKQITVPQSLTTIGYQAFYHCIALESITIPSVNTIESEIFNGCSALTDIKLSPQTTTIGEKAFYQCTSLAEIHLPPYLKSIADAAFANCSKLKTIYAYMPDIISIGGSTFPNMATATLYVPDFLYKSYYYDTNWSQFLHVIRCDLRPGDYESFYTNGDIIFEQGAQRITEDTPIAEIGSQGGVIVQGEPQQFDTVDQTIGDMNSTTSTGASLIGDGTTAQENNLPMNELRVKMTVQAKKWYFFCFPFDVTIEQCEYPGRYAWRYYDGAIRAANGSGGWQPVTGETLTARQGYAFQSEKAGTLVVKFNHPTFGGDRVKELVAHATSNAANASWNFIGNPYSSYYDFRSEDITSPITIWNGSSYVAYRPGDDECHLKPYQAFFVQKPTASVQVTFNVQRRETYRQSEATKAARMNARRKQGISPKRRLINLEIMSDTVMLDRTRVVLNPEAASAYELEYDAAKFLSDDSKAQIYSVENGIQMAINERPLAGDIRLGYTAKKAGRLSISAPRMDIPMVLVDMKLGITFDLTLGTYDFDTSAGIFNDRFLLRQGGDATAINNLTAKTGVCFGTQDGGIAIGGAEGKTVNVYTTGGALAAQHSGNGFIALKSGIYVVSVDGVSAKVRVR